jgi:hypothetical protein
MFGTFYFRQKNVDIPPEKFLLSGNFFWGGERKEGAQMFEFTPPPTRCPSARPWMGFAIKCKRTGHGMINIYKGTVSVNTITPCNLFVRSFS